MALSYRDLSKHLSQVVPFKSSWIKEAYGPQNIKNATRDEVKRALYCVTPTPAVVKQFKDGDYDILLTHHPFVAGVPQFIAHTALDCVEGGLNDQWRDVFKLKNPKHFDGNLGWYGEIEPTSLQDLIKRSEDFVGAPLIGEHHGHEHPIKSVVICTGLGGMVEKQAHATGADCYVLGEATKHSSESPFKARIEVGHTLSEHGTGLAFFRKHLEPHGIIVDGSDLDKDKYSGEVYRKPVYHPYFAEKGVKGNYAGWRSAARSRDLSGMGRAPGAMTGLNSDSPWSEESESEDSWGIKQDEEAEFWNRYWASSKDDGTKGPVKIPPKESFKPKLDTSSRGTGIQGLHNDSED